MVGGEEKGGWRGGGEERVDFSLARLDSKKYNGAAARRVRREEGGFQKVRSRRYKSSEDEMDI